MGGASRFRPSVAGMPQLLIRNQREKTILNFQMERVPVLHPSGADGDGVPGLQTLPKHLSPRITPVAF